MLVSQDKVRESSTGSIKIASGLALVDGGGAGVRFQTSPSIVFPKTVGCFVLFTQTLQSVSLGPQTEFSVLRMVKGLFDDCFYSPIKLAWSSVCKPLNSLNISLSLWVDEPIKNI